jgi:hypothetical protein
MIVDANNRMIGAAPHIRPIGPHEHAWAARGSDPYGAYLECEACGARRYTGVQDLAGRKDWLSGRADFGEQAQPQGGLEPATPEDVAREQKAAREEQRNLPREYVEARGEADLPAPVPLGTVQAPPAPASAEPAPTPRHGAEEAKGAIEAEKRGRR